MTEGGKPGHCKHDPPRSLAYPNGATPLDNGDILISEIRGSWISRISRSGTVVWSVQAPRMRYPADAFPTRDGQVIVADGSRPERVVIFDPGTRRVSWEYDVRAGEKMLDHPSLARELPGTGDIIVVDDLRDRVVVIDRHTREIIWQYGVTGTKGHAPGHLNYPDGFDLDVPGLEGRAGRHRRLRPAPVPALPCAPARLYRRRAEAKTMTEPVRVDKWLWAARFFKTRSLAAAACDGGKVDVNDQAAKPSRLLRPGDMLRVTLPSGRRIAKVLVPSDRRGSGAAARALYEDLTPPAPPRSRQAPPPYRPPGAGRPTKRERRETDRLRGWS